MKTAIIKLNPIFFMFFNAKIVPIKDKNAIAMPIIDIAESCNIFP